MSEAVYLVLVFASLTLGVWSLTSMWARRRDLRRRLSEVSRDSATGDDDWLTGLERAARPVANLAMPAAAEELSALRRRLANAGWRMESAAWIYFGVKSALALVVPAVVWAVLVSAGVTWSFAAICLLLLAGAASGYYLPNLILRTRVERRQREIFEAFPDALDLMLVCVESGLALDMAINRAAAEMTLRSPALAEELALVGVDLRVGSSRERALRNLALRTGVDEVASFVSMVTQADRFGTSVGDALRVQADALRSVRHFRAEERAAKVPLKLLFPLIFFVFPSLFTVLLGPAAIRVWRVLLPAVQTAT